jgi:hypothetical protein
MDRQALKQLGIARSYSIVKERMTKPPRSGLVQQ